MDITRERLQNQRLVGEKLQKAEDVIYMLGAVQSQDFPAAKWSLAQRLTDATDSSIEASYNEGRILRTHVMRPTWHFVLPEDICWMQELTSQRVKKLMAHYNRKLELDDEVFKNSQKAIKKALQNNNYLTRQELKKILLAEGIETDVQRLAHIIMWAELDCLIINGPKRGKQFTYALLEERVKKSRRLSHEEALSTLAFKYFSSHGPAQLKDFSWWSGLTVKDAQEALKMIGSKLEVYEKEEKSYFFIPNRKKVTSNHAFLLSIFDEYTIAYNDRSDLSEVRDIERMISMGNALTAVMILNGKAVGTWKRKLSTKKVEVKISPFRKLTAAELELFEKETLKYGKFLGLPQELIY